MINDERFNDDPPPYNTVVLGGLTDANAGTLPQYSRTSLQIYSNLTRNTGTEANTGTDANTGTLLRGKYNIKRFDICEIQNKDITKSQNF